jgi:hypothetical protein
MKRVLPGVLLGVCLFAGCNNGPSGPPPIGVSVSATTATSVPAGGTVTLTATVTNDSSNKGVTWSVSCSAASCGSVSPTSTASGASTTYTAPSAPPNTNLSVTITATSVADTSKSGSATVTVLAITVSVAPATATVDANSSAAFTATVANDPANAGVTWTVSCGAPPCGSVSPTSTASGVSTTYTAPTTPPANNLTVTLTATSVTNGANSGSATITVPAITVSVAPATATVQAGATQQFTATVNNFPTNTAVTWTLTQSGVPCSPSCGTLSSATSNPVTYTAPSTTPSSNLSVTITATSSADPSKSGSATITVPAITVAVSPSTATVEAAGTQQFTATVGNTSNTGVTWSISLTQGGVSCSPSCGTLSSTTTNPTTYTAPSTPPSSNLTVYITATSSADPSKSGSATITVPAITVAVSPTSATVAVNAMQNFTATVSNDPSNKGVSWGLSGAGCSGSTCGTLSNKTTTSVTYTAPASVPSPPTVTLTATSVTDGTKSASATITISSGVNDAELNGHYAFLFNGFNDVSSAQVMMVASFVADGTGNITSGEVGVCQGGAPACPTGGTGTITGTYTIGADNRGTMNLTYTSGMTSINHSYAIAVGTITSGGIAQKARFIEFDDTTPPTGARGEGVMFLQNTAAFTQASINGKYAFGFAGHDPTGSRFAMAGVANANGSGGVTGGEADQNDAGTITNSISITGGSYTTPDTAGIGSFTLTVSGGTTTTPVNWEYAVVDAGHLLVVTTGSGATVATISGEALVQTLASFSNSSLNGNAVEYNSGLGSGGAGSSSVTIGVVAANGSGGATLTEDINDGGSITADSTLSGITYSVATGGRVTTNASGPILFLVGTNEAFILSTNNSVEFGFLEPQSAGPFSTSTVRGNYFFGVEPPVVTASSVSSGVATSSGNGILDITSDESDANGTLTSGATFSDTLTLSSSTLGRFTDSLGDAIYVVSPRKFVVIDESAGDTAPTITIVEQ